MATVGLWRNTSAITTVYIDLVDGQDMQQAQPSPSTELRVHNGKYL
jgi:hypothetical protein